MCYALSVWEIKIIIKEQLGDILFISFVIASGEAIIFYFEWIL